MQAFDVSGPMTTVLSSFSYRGGKCGLGMLQVHSSIHCCVLGLFRAFTHQHISKPGSCGANGSEKELEVPRRNQELGTHTFPWTRGHSLVLVHVGKR